MGVLHLARSSKPLNHTTCSIPSRDFAPFLNAVGLEPDSSSAPRAWNAVAIRLCSTSVHPGRHIV